MPTVEAAETPFGEFAECWCDTYRGVIHSWEASWNEFVPFLEFPTKLRTIVYTTTRSSRSTPGRRRVHFPNEKPP